MISRRHNNDHLSTVTEEIPTRTPLRGLAAGIVSAVTPGRDHLNHAHATQPEQSSLVSSTIASPPTTDRSDPLQPNYAPHSDTATDQQGPRHPGTRSGGDVAFIQKPAFSPTRRKSPEQASQSDVSREESHRLDATSVGLNAPPIPAEVRQAPNHTTTKEAEVNAKRTAKTQSSATGLLATLASLLRPGGSRAPSASAPIRALLLAAAAAALLAAAPASAAQFGLTELKAGFTDQSGAVSMQAGTHPFAMSLSGAVQTEAGLPVEALKDVRIDFPAGLAGSVVAAPRCSAAQFLAGESSGGECPDATAIGTAAVEYGLSATATKFETVPLYNLDPPPGAAAKVGFLIEGGVVQVTSDVYLNPEPPYNLVALAPNISQAAFALKFGIDVWGVPTASAHDPYRGKCLLPSGNSRCTSPVPPRVPLLTMPTSCAAPLATTFEADSWLHPGTPYPFSETILTRGESGEPLALGGCAGLRFAPTITARPTSKAASSPSGLDFSLDVEDEGLTNPREGAAADSDIEKAEVTLPEGFSTNPSLAEGLAVCTETDLARETASSAPGAGCPNESKIGTVEVQSPLIEETVDGALYVAEPYENPFHSLIALYLVLKDQQLGISVKQPLKVEPNPVTGRLTTVAEELPQLPFSHFRLHFREGTRSPLASPPSCGSHSVKAVLYPWSGGSPVETTSAFEIISGPDNGPCPSGGIPPFHPGLIAGSLNAGAGQYSPFYLDLSRTDSEQEITHFSIKLPPGLVGKLAGILFCPDAAIAAAKAREGTPHGGAEELTSPSCPAASEVGHTLVGAGVGPSLTYVPGKVYLAGPYHGAPISIVAITAAKVGPFDLGTVVVREALKVNPETAEVFVDATGSDPIPHIVDGIPVHLRDIRVYIDRPEFTLNPTCCEADLDRLHGARLGA